MILPFPELGSGMGVPPVRFESNGRDARATAVTPVPGFKAQSLRWEKSLLAQSRQHIGAPAIRSNL
ncbi:MAG: hypothetical protein IH623_15855 [Verrucomicrobia bacterium]|nr:hypothetical protein [Verrucomicrobiota bacterium]